mgnify:CR=1 FL=1
MTALDTTYTNIVVWAPSVGESFDTAWIYSLKFESGNEVFDDMLVRSTTRQLAIDLCRDTWNKCIRIGSIPPCPGKVPSAQDVPVSTSSGADTKEFKAELVHACEDSGEEFEKYFIPNANGQELTIFISRAMIKPAANSEPACPNDLLRGSW